MFQNLHFRSFGTCSRVKINRKLKNNALKIRFEKNLSSTLCHVSLHSQTMNLNPKWFKVPSSKVSLFLSMFFYSFVCFTTMLNTISFPHCFLGQEFPFPLLKPYQFHANICQMPWKPLKNFTKELTT